MHSINACVELVKFIKHYKNRHQKLHLEEDQNENASQVMNKSVEVSYSFDDQLSQIVPEMPHGSNSLFQNTNTHRKLHKDDRNEDNKVSTNTVK